MNDSSTILDVRPDTALIPPGATLDGFVECVAHADGVDIRDLEPLTTIVVRTRNSIYRFIISRETSVLVQGGQFFPDATPGRLDGSSLGGSLLKVAWIGVGLRMEIFAGGQRIITSTVRDISIERRTLQRQH